jgi:hypothetical protein
VIFIKKEDQDECIILGMTLSISIFTLAKWDSALMM